MGDEGLEPNACSPDEIANSKTGGTPGGTMALERLGKLTELLGNIASLSNEDLARVLDIARHFEDDCVIADDDTSQ